jgi:hypothetical protein
LRRRGWTFPFSSIGARFASAAFLDALRHGRECAFFNPTSGYTPSEIRFSLPAKRYLKRHQRLPVDAISKYRPRPSNKRTVFF